MVDVSLFRPGLRGRCHAEAGAERAALPGGHPGTYGPAMSLTPEEIERYARHLVLADIGGPGQAKLKAARVLVIGAGGLGAPLLQYLAAAGIGTIGIVDDDVVSLSNLQRQVIHASADVGRPKVASAEAAIRRLNPHVAVNVHPTRLTAENARGLVAGYDVVADGSDNFDTRYAVSDACFFERRPLVTAALGQFDGSLTTIRAHETGPEGKPNPTYRCLFPAPPPPGAIPACAEAGILGALAGVMGSLMAMEVIREIVGFGDGLVGRLLMVDARGMRFETMRYGWDAATPLNGASAP
jgi:molybdopterin-synthase adenylyltransferase